MISFLIAGALAAAALFILPRFLGARQERMLRQYQVLESRFGLSRRVAQSRWGKGIGEHHSLFGEHRGYPLSLYSHFVKRGKERADWTSLAFEALFAEDLEFRIGFQGTEPKARFEEPAEVPPFCALELCSLSASEDLSQVFEDESVAKRLAFWSSQAGCGAIRLSKGFLEYREFGVMETDAQRLRFQEAIMLLASLADALSIYMVERNAIARYDLRWQAGGATSERLRRLSSAEALLRALPGGSRS